MPDNPLLERASVVYFVTPIRSRRVKIGTSTNFNARLKALQATNHIPLSVLLLLPGDSVLEGTLHHRFKKSRVRGEWFTLSDEIKTFIGENGGQWLPPSGSYTKRNRAAHRGTSPAAFCGTNETGRNGCRDPRGPTTTSIGGSLG